VLTEDRGQSPSPRLRRAKEDRNQKFATANPSFGGSELRERRCKPFQVLLSALAPSQPLILSEFFSLKA
jgi:hypothetical protein